MKTFDQKTFGNGFSNLPFSVIDGVDESEDKLEIFNALITQYLEDHVPLKRIKITRAPAPWMKDLDIVSLQNQCREWRHKCHQPNNLETDWEKFRYYRNKLKKSTKTTKKQFYRKALQSKKPKEVWSIIHRILSPNQKKITSSPEKLNSYYVNPAETLTDKQSATPTELNEIINNLPSTNKDSFVLKTVTYQQVLNEINSIRNDSSSGCDNLPINLLKPLAETIAFPMTTIINDCIRKCIFPEQWKVAKVCPIPKVHNPSQSKDYHPISILPIFSKILERVTMKQLCLFLEDQLVFSKSQSGFRKNHSTNTLLIKMRDDILNAQDRGEVTIAVLTDFSKAFDTVDFAALLQKLHKLNFSKEALKFILSYLTDRKQFVQIDDKISSNKTVKLGVPQGSILGPVLFNIYVSDMDTVCEGSTCLQYADDSNIYNHCKPADIPESITKLQTNINEVHKWSKSKNLIFNPDKTKFMIFSTKKSQAKCTKYTFQADNEIILERTDATKILGVNFQQQLNWDSQVNEITRSCDGVLRTLRKIKRITPFKIRKHLSESLVLSKIDYCNSVFDPLT